MMAERTGIRREKEEWDGGVRVVGGFEEEEDGFSRRRRE